MHLAALSLVRSQLSAQSIDALLARAGRNLLLLRLDRTPYSPTVEAASLLAHLAARAQRLERLQWVHCGLTWPSHALPASALPDLRELRVCGCTATRSAAALSELRDERPRLVMLVEPCHWQRG